MKHNIEMENINLTNSALSLVKIKRHCIDHQNILKTCKEIILSCQVGGDFTEMIKKELERNYISVIQDQKKQKVQTLTDKVWFKFNFKHYLSLILSDMNRLTRLNYISWNSLPVCFRLEWTIRDIFAWDLEGRGVAVAMLFLILWRRWGGVQRPTFGGHTGSHASAASLIGMEQHLGLCLFCLPRIFLLRFCAHLREGSTCFSCRTPVSSRSGAWELTRAPVCPHGFSPGLWVLASGFPSLYILLLFLPDCLPYRLQAPGSGAISTGSRRLAVSNFNNCIWSNPCNKVCVCVCICVCMCTHMHVHTLTHVCNLLHQLQKLSEKL